ncbi:unnamed protein product (macronuclear) [Paramecium tetraurelia]|uniref:Uncharacterized protein n=1 Tax=Paramecium tetraurelia TaxID=5888 RepID=A0DC02_PARTE|nr:uncharacterized protein GSPATT00015446001 [Paramecium tetraurelia]CAK80569.1 unnamed protein product [Paramecium tetraurelia]|eukprot:XP_001447966.1 hypothetical protein (macronuclear) [Paramecium tetraurelia strain d4-2]
MKDQFIEKNQAGTNQKVFDISTEYQELFQNFKLKILDLFKIMENCLSKLIELEESIINQNRSIEINSLSKIFKDCQPYIEMKLLDCVNRLNMYINVIEFWTSEQQQVENEKNQAKTTYQQNSNQIKRQDLINMNENINAENKKQNENKTIVPENQKTIQIEKYNENEYGTEKQNINENEISLSYNQNGSQFICDLSTSTSTNDQGKLEIKQSIEQNETCLAIAFNKNNTLMISGSGEIIKLWKLIDGTIQDNSLLLYGHTKLVTSLVFTNEDRYFISGGEDGEIRFWKKIQPNVWQSTKLAVFSRGVTGLLFNHSNQQIISIGKDPLIKIIELNQQKMMKISQTLDQHKSSLFCICMDESESIMASSDADKFLLIWIKDKNGGWQYKQTVNQFMNDYFGRMAFINKQTIICQQWSKPISQVFYEENEQFIQQPKLQIKLSENSSEDEDLFPTVYNQKQGILIQKHGQYVYILKKQMDTQFVQICQPVDCQDQYNYGSLTNDGNCLVIWSFQTKKFQRYNLI